MMSKEFFQIILYERSEMDNNAWLVAGDGVANVGLGNARVMLLFTMCRGKLLKS